MALSRTLARAALVAAGLALWAGPAAAEMYRCQGPDGEILFTSDQSQCPGAEVHEPKGRVQSLPARSLPASGVGDEAVGFPSGRDRAGAVPESVVSGAQASQWRRKKQQAIAEQQAITERLPYVERAIRFCNRGNNLYIEDVDGMRQSYSCDKVEAEAAQLAQRKRELDQYLGGGGLQEECRRAGCLPGWIRD